MKILRTAFIFGLLFGSFYTAARAQGEVDVAGPEDDSLVLGYDLLHQFSALAGIALEDMSSGTTQLVGPNTDNGNSAVMSTGFLFRFQDTTYTTFSVSGNGFVLLGPLAVTGNQNINTTPSSAHIRRLMPYWDDLCVGNTGKVHYKTVGAAPNKKLVIEWKNMKISRGAGCDGSGNATFQLWIAEHTGAIQFVYGDGMIEAAAVDNGYSVGLSAGGRGIASVTTAGGTCNFFSANDNQRDPIAAGTSYLFTPPMPEAPTHGTVNPLGQSALTLRWADNAFYETGYYIRRSTTGAEDSYIHLGTLPANSTSFTDSGLTPGTRYYYIVNAITFYAVSQDLVFSPTTRPIATTTSSAAGGLWSSPSTWSNGLVPAAEDVIQIAPGATVIIDTAAVAGSILVGGEEEFGDQKSTEGAAPAVVRFGDAGPFSLVVAHNLTIGPNDTFSTGEGSGNQHVLTVGGDLINNGTFDLSTNNNAAGAGLVFTGARSNVFSGTGPITDIRTITLNKGGSNANILELSTSNFTVQGTTTDGPVSGYLFFQSGTFKISGTFPGTHRTFPAAAYQIPGNCGFWLDNPNYTVTPQNRDVVNLGKLRVTAGTYNIGTEFGNSLLYMLNSSTTIEGGHLNIAGRFSRSTPQGTSASQYTQTGGTVTVCKIGHSSTELACFERSGTMTGGDVVIQNPGPQVVPDYWASLTAEAGSSVGTVHFGNAQTSGAASFRGAGTFPNVHIPGPNTLSIPTSQTTVAPKMRNLTIDPGAKLVLGGSILTFEGSSIVNNGEIAFRTAGNFPEELLLGGGNTNDVEYSGTGTMSGALYQLRMKCRSLTFDPSAGSLRVRHIDIESGRFINAEKLILGNNDGSPNRVTYWGAAGADSEPPVFDEVPAFDLGTGGQELFYRNGTGVARTIGLELNPSRTLNQLRYEDPSTLTIGDGDLTTRGIMLTRGRVITGANKITAEFVTTNGGYIHGTLKWNISRTGEHLFPVGTADYSYVTVNVSAFASGSFLTITPVDTTLPGLLPSASASRYWSILEEGDITATLKFYYRDSDVRGTEANYVLWSSSGGVPTPRSSSVDTFLNTVTSSAPITDLTANWGIGAQLDPSPVSISGSILTSSGAGIRNAIVTISGGNLPAPVSVQTGQFGAYTFEGLQAGEVYTIQASAKRFRFGTSSQQVTPAGNVTGVNFVANPQD